jgi:hypothetical protein
MMHDPIASNALYGTDKFTMPGFDGEIDPKGTVAEQLAAKAYGAYRNALAEVIRTAEAVERNAKEAVKNAQAVLDDSPGYGVSDTGMHTYSQQYAVACGKALALREALNLALRPLWEERKAKAAEPVTI